MSLILVLIGTNRFLQSAAQEHRTFGLLQMMLLFLVGIWAGLIVLDSYTYLLLTLVLAVGCELVGANALKAISGIGVTAAAIALFADQAEVEWSAGSVMSVGWITGAWLGAKLAASERSKVWVFRVLVVTIRIPPLCQSPRLRHRRGRKNVPEIGVPCLSCRPGAL
jgi:uncharacterized protein